MIKYLIYEIIQKFYILEEYGIMTRFNGMDIYHTKLYVNNNCGTYLKLVLDIHGCNYPGKKEPKLVKNAYADNVKIRVNLLPREKVKPGKSRK